MTHQYTNLKKIKIRKLRLVSSTAGKLGVRLSGLRVYRPLENNYIIHNSRLGDRLSTSNDLKKVLKFYLHDGEHLRTELIPPFIQSLKKLHDAIQHQTTFDFQASSILLIYEGQNDKTTQQSTPSPNVDVRLIDFDHASHRPYPVDEDTTGVALGISTVLNLFEQILQSTQKSRSYSELQKNFDVNIQKSPKGSISLEEDE